MQKSGGGVVEFHQTQRREKQQGEVEESAQKHAEKFFQQRCDGGNGLQSLMIVQRCGQQPTDKG